MPQWAGSCWYYLRYLDPDNDAAFVDPAVERYWMEPGGVDLYVGGVEHAVLHLLYARFWHKVLYDLGLRVDAGAVRPAGQPGHDPGRRVRRRRGACTCPPRTSSVAPDGSASYQGRPVTRRAGKMGKSLKNGVSPDEMYRRYGADTLRLYEMAMGPLEVDKPWRTDDVIGVHRFLQRLWRCVVDEQTGAADRERRAAGRRHASTRCTRRSRAVGRDFGQLRFNTAIARLMELVTAAARLSAEWRAAAGAGRATGADDRAAGSAHRRGAVGQAGPSAVGGLRAVPGGGPGAGRGERRHRAGPGERADPVPDPGRGWPGRGAVEEAVRAHPEYARWTAGGSVRADGGRPDRIVNIVVRQADTAAPPSPTRPRP